MPANPIWQLQAREDPLLIYEFVGLDNPAAAEPLVHIDRGENDSADPSSTNGATPTGYPARCATPALDSARAARFAMIPDYSYEFGQGLLSLPPSCGRLRPFSNRIFQLSPYRHDQLPRHLFHPPQLGWRVAVYVRPSVSTP
jgi:hypothetical protein